MSPAAAQAHSPAPAITKRPPALSARSGRVEDEEVKPYVIVSDLGKGSFATVYRGYHEVSLLEFIGKQSCQLCLYHMKANPQGGRHQDCRQEWSQRQDPRQPEERNRDPEDLIT